MTMIPERIRREYAGKAPSEWERLRSTPITRIEYLITIYCLERHLPGKGLVLDAGSGPGRYAIHLARLGYRVVAFDLVREMLEFARDRLATDEGGAQAVCLAEGNIASLPYTDEAFDSIVSLGAPLSHIIDPQARSSAVGEMARVVKPGGKVLITGLTRLAELSAVRIRGIPLLRVNLRIWYRAWDWKSSIGLDAKDWPHTCL